MKEFITGRKLGEGAYATVKKAIHIESRKTVAIKEIVISTLNENDFENIENEVRIHQKLEHEHVIKLLGYFVEAGSLYMVLENAEGGNLYKYLTNNYPMDKEEVRRIWAQTVRGVGYLHEKGVLMRDIKPENVILAKDVTAKLCDFGWAAWMTDEGYRKIRGGTYIYMSPEALRGELQGLESDVWSLGVLLFELNHAMEPFALGVTCEQQLEFVVGGKIRFKTTLDPKIRGLIEKCLAFEAGKRPTLAELQDLEYVKGVAEVGMVYEEICMVEGILGGGFLVWVLFVNSF